MGFVNFLSDSRITNCVVQYLDLLSLNSVVTLSILCPPEII